MSEASSLLRSAVAVGVGMKEEVVGVGEALRLNDSLSLLRSAAVEAREGGGETLLSSEACSLLSSTVAVGVAMEEGS